MPPVTCPSALRLLCPAKINLHLRVGPRRQDGFHPLLSWMVTVGLFDTLALEAAAGGTSTATGEAAGATGTIGTAGDAAAPPATPVTLACDAPDLPCDARNLVVRIAAAWGTEIGRDRGERGGESSGESRPAASADATAATAPGTATVPGPGTVAARVARLDGGGTGPAGQSGPPGPAGAAAARVRPVSAVLHKRIPVGAGLGGGSSDAARALLGLNWFWGAGRAADVLSAFAARFGSDLPFFLFGPSSVCRGRGEVVRPVPPPRPRWAVLLLPPIHMPTADVYRRFDEMGLGRETDVANEPDWRGWATLNAADLLSLLVNDLEPAAYSIRPDLGRLRREAELALGRVVRMSGSGSSLFTLFDAEPEARAAARVAGERLGIVAEAVEVAPRIDDDLAGLEGS